MKILPFVGIEITLNIGMIMVSGCTTSNQSTTGLTPQAITPVQSPTWSINPTPIKWEGCTCTVEKLEGEQWSDWVAVICHLSDVEITRHVKGIEESIDPSIEHNTCIYTGGSTCMCAEGRIGEDPSNHFAYTCTENTCTCTPGTCTYSGGGSCTCTPESCTCKDLDPCSCTKKTYPCNPDACIKGSCYCGMDPCTCL